MCYKCIRTFHTDEDEVYQYGDLINVSTYEKLTSQQQRNFEKYESKEDLIKKEKQLMELN